MLFCVFVFVFVLPRQCFLFHVFVYLCLCFYVLCFMFYVFVYGLRLCFFSNLCLLCSYIIILKQNKTGQI